MWKPSAAVERQLQDNIAEAEDLLNAYHSSVLLGSGGVAAGLAFITGTSLLHAVLPVGLVIMLCIFGVAVVVLCGIFLGRSVYEAFITRENRHGREVSDHPRAKLARARRAHQEYIASLGDD